MTFDKLRLSIYESYQNDEISRETATTMLESVLEMEGDHIVAEAEEARTEFMGVALECAGGDVGYAVFEKKAETFGDKIKNAWKKLVAWIKKIIDSIAQKLGFAKKKSLRVKINADFMKAIDSIINVANGFVANASPAQIVAAIAAFGSAVAALAVGIFKGHKMITANAGEVVEKGNKGLKACHIIAGKMEEMREAGKNLVDKDYAALDDEAKAKYNAAKKDTPSDNKFIGLIRKATGFIRGGISSIIDTVKTGKLDDEAKAKLAAAKDKGAVADTGNNTKKGILPKKGEDAYAAAKAALAAANGVSAESAKLSNVDGDDMYESMLADLDFDFDF